MSSSSDVGPGSPPTSPAQRRAVSPPTSPLQRQDEGNNDSSSSSQLPSSDSSSSSSQPPSPKRRRKSGHQVYRTTVIRRLEAEGSDEDAFDALHDEGGHNHLLPDANIDGNGLFPAEGDNALIDANTFDSSDTSSQGEISNEDSSSVGPGDINSSSDAIQSDNSDNFGDNVSDDKDDQNFSSDSDEGAAPVHEGTDTTLNKSVLLVLKLYMKERWTKTSLNESVKVIQKLLPQPNNFPTSGKKLLKHLKDLTCTFTEKVYTYCAKCSHLLDDNADVCNREECDSEELNRFHSFPIEDQIKHFFEQRNLAEAIDDHRKNRKKKPGHICDIQDGSGYIRVRVHLEGPYDIVLLINTDGVPLSDSSIREMWPIQATICDVPLRLRPSFTIVCGVYVGTKKPNMNVFLQPVVDSIKHMFNTGVTWVHPITKETITSKVTAPAVSLDAPARAEVLRHSYHNSNYGCNVCEQKTKKIALTPAEILENQGQQNPRKRKKRKRRFVYQDDFNAGVLRTDERMAQQSAAAKVRGQPCKGVIEDATVCEIPLFDRASCVTVEYLHLVCLGVVKYLLLKIFFDKEGEWFIGDQLSEIDAMLSDIRVPDFVKRLPRGIKEIKFWKGSEFRNFLLFYSLPIFKGRLPKKYFDHWLLLVGAVFIVLQEAISDVDLRCAQLMFTDFVRSIGELYGDKCYTYNVHNLLHVSLLVERWGPLYATSAFSFETLGGFLSSHIHGTKNYGQELANNMKIFQGVAILENVVNSGLKISSKKCTSTSIHMLGQAWSANVLSEAERSQISALLPRTEFTVYNRARVGSSVFSCCFYDKTKKRSNSYVQYGQSEFGQIIAFLKCDDGSVFCCLRKIKITHSDVFFHEETEFVIKHMLPFEILKHCLYVIPVKDLSLKLLKVHQYLALPPNEYEINL